MQPLHGLRGDLEEPSVVWSSGELGRHIRERQVFIYFPRLSKMTTHNTHDDWEVDDTPWWDSSNMSDGNSNGFQTQVTQPSSICPVNLTLLISDWQHPICDVSNQSERSHEINLIHDVCWFPALIPIEPFTPCQSNQVNSWRTAVLAFFSRLWRCDHMQDKGSPMLWEQCRVVLVTQLKEVHQWCPRTLNVENCNVHM